MLKVVYSGQRSLIHTKRCHFVYLSHQFCGAARREPSGKVPECCGMSGDDCDGHLDSGGMELLPMTLRFLEIITVVITARSDRILRMDWSVGYSTDQQSDRVTVADARNN